MVLLHMKVRGAQSLKNHSFSRGMPRSQHRPAATLAAALGGGAVPV
jgi:hypothetical protein